MEYDGTLTHEQMLARATAAAEEGAERAGQSPHRPAYHFAPPSGWMNDPNGLIRWRGRYHAFYQHYPFAPRGGPMHWGHAVSDDLLHWRHLPVALAPSEPYDRAPGDGACGCFSGSAVDDDGTLTLVYTGHRHDREPNQVQCIATGTDGLTFSKYEGNPVIAEPPPEAARNDFRDPKVWRHDGLWYMVVGTGKDGRGRVVLYRSDDLREWEYLGVAAESDGTQGHMWECPDLFPLGDRHALVCSPVGADRPKAICLVGEMDYRAGRFTPEREADADLGPSFYAPQTFMDDDGRRIMFGWMSSWGEEAPTTEYGWAGALTLPRVVTLGPDGCPRFTPAPELRALRGQEASRRDLLLRPGAVQVLDEAAGQCLELALEIERPAEDARFVVELRRSADGARAVAIIVDSAKGMLTIASDGAQSRHSSAPLPGPVRRLQVFLDRSSVELFVDDGRAVMTSTVYPDPADRGVALRAEGDPVRVKSLQVWPIASAW
jgi:beta-fructofuranosidase